METASNATNATPPAPKAPPKRNPINALVGKHTVSNIERDYSAVLAALSWDPTAADVLTGGEKVEMNSGNRILTSKEIFAGCETAWGKRPGGSSKDAAWQAFDAGVGRVMAQARRAHLIKDAAGIVCDSPDAARRGTDATPRVRKSASLLHDGTLCGEPWPAHCGEALVAAIGGRLPGRDALAAALQSLGYVLTRDDATGITTIEAPKPRTLTAEQTAKLEKAEALDRKATGLEKDGIAEAATFVRKAAANLRAEVEAEYAAGGAKNGAMNGTATVPPAGAPKATAPLAADFGGYLASLSEVDIRLAAASFRKWIPEGEGRPNAKALKIAGKDEVMRLCVVAYEALSDDARAKMLAEVFPGIDVTAPPAN